MSIMQLVFRSFQLHVRLHHHLYCFPFFTKSSLVLPNNGYGRLKKANKKAIANLFPLVIPTNHRKLPMLSANAKFHLFTTFAKKPKFIVIAVRRKQTNIFVTILQYRPTLCACCSAFILNSDCIIMI